jgi:alkylation response protein AidB-like acyl-CoA dehydrogenase
LNLSKDQELVKETVRKIAQRELAPRAAEIDKTHSFLIYMFRDLSLVWK